MTSFIPDKAGIHIQRSQIKEIILKCAIENGISFFLSFSIEPLHVWRDAAGLNLKSLGDSACSDLEYEKRKLKL